jgi:hypothetical protein
MMSISVWKDLVAAGAFVVFAKLFVRAQIYYWYNPKFREDYKENAENGGDTKHA